MLITNMSNRRNGRALDDDELRRFAPSVFSMSAWDQMSDKYALVPTIDVINGLRNEGFMPVQAAQSRVRNADKREYTKHLVRLRHVDTLASQQPEVGEIVLTNAHDGTAAFQLFLGIYRLVCTNGLMLGQTFESYHVRHFGPRVTDEVIDATYHVADQLPRVMDRIGEMKALPMPETAALALAMVARDLRWKPDEEIIEGEVVEHPTAPIEPAQLLQARRSIDANDNSVWGVYNRVQESIMKGGLPGTGSGQRRMSTRAVNSVNAEITLNRRIWDVASQLTDFLKKQTA
jgi:hypothetical protein